MTNKSASEAELKPCPLCQSIDLAHGLIRGFNPDDGHAVRCEQCGCRASLKAWNTRVSASSPAPDMDSTTLAAPLPSTQRVSSDGLAAYREQANLRLWKLCGSRDDAPNWSDIQTVLRELKDAKTWGVPDYPRACVNCGKVAPANVGRGDYLCKDNHPNQDFYACTIDMTYDEAMEEIKSLGGRIAARIRDIEQLETTIKNLAVAPAASDEASKLNYPSPAPEPVAWVCWWDGNSDATVVKSRADDWVRLGRKVEPSFMLPLNHRATEAGGRT